MHYTTPSSGSQAFLFAIYATANKLNHTLTNLDQKELYSQSVWRRTRVALKSERRGQKANTTSGDRQGGKQSGWKVPVRDFARVARFGASLRCVYMYLWAGGRGNDVLH